MKRTNPRNKYGAIRTEVNGVLFDSMMEAARYRELKLLERAGQIKNLVTHPKYAIVINGKKICTVELDFCYWDENLRRVVHEDVKGQDNALSRLKRKLVCAVHGVTVSVIWISRRSI